GHDKRYALDITKIREVLSWEPEISFEDGLRSTIDWYLENTRWVDGILNGTYLNYYQTQYGERLHGGKH
ncbi:MAG: dTDP-glucose 4,6-dehydratase, partial [Desulfobacterales bacterium]|nr:dTDP-glucose 4,6-dehydratase [Desulfobacterales bacterium]